MRNRKAEIVWLLVGLLILAGLVPAVYGHDWAAARTALGQALASPGLLLAALALFFAALCASLLKWHYMSRRVGAGFSWRHSLRLFGTLYLVGTFTPGRAGELFVPVLMRGGGRLTGVALVNRVLEGSWTVFVGAIVIISLFAGSVDNARLWALAPVVLVLLAAVTVLSRRRFTKALFALGRACLKPFARFGPVARLLALDEKYAAALEPFYDANERLLQPASVLVFSLLMLVIWIATTAANYLLVLASVPDAQQVTFLIVLALITVNAVATFLSPIPGGLGLAQGLQLVLLASLGYKKEDFGAFVLLALLEFYAAVLLFYLAGRFLGRPLPEPPAPPTV
jgi:uncharacterized protein (TIRG00374 family)